MNTAGDAAEQIVKVSLEGVEIVLRLAGSAAKHLAAALYAVARDNAKKNANGIAWLKDMTASGEPLKVFTIRTDNANTFAEAASKYGLSYCVVRDSVSEHDGMIDIIVRAADAEMVNHIIDRYHLSGIESATVSEAEQDAPVTDVDELMSEFNFQIRSDIPSLAEGAPEAGEVTLEYTSMTRVQGGRTARENPSEARTVSAPSGHSLLGNGAEGEKEVVSERASRDDLIRGVDYVDRTGEKAPRRSVRERLREIKARRAEAKEQRTPEKYTMGKANAAKVRRTPKKKGR